MCFFYYSLRGFVFGGFFWDFLYRGLMFFLLVLNILGYVDCCLYIEGSLSLNGYNSIFMSCMSSGD